MIFFSRIVIFGLLFGVLGLFGVPGLCLAQPQSPSVLILNSYHQGYHWSDQEIDGFLKEFQAARPGVVPAIEHLDLKRSQNPEHPLRLKSFLAEKYRGRKVDLLVVLDNPGFELLLRHRDEILPGVPIVFAGINDFTPAMLTGQDRVTGVAEIQDSTGTLSLSLGLHPQVRRVLAVHDYTASGLAVRREIKAGLAAFQGRVEVEFNAPCTYEELAQRISELPEDYLVLILSFATDSAGRALDPQRSTATLTARSRVPVYAMHETRLGHGIVGGLLIGGQDHGRRIAAVALRVLAGEDPGSIPVETGSASRPMFDYLQLKRFDIPVDKLPPGSLLVNRQSSFYEEHPELVWAGASILAWLLIMIAVLLFLLGRKNRAERAVLESEDNLSRMVENAPDAIYVQADGFIQYANSEAVKLFGASSVEALIGRPMLDLVHPSSRDVIQSRMRTLDAKQPVPRSAHMYLRLDGEAVDVEAVAVPLRYRGRDGALVFARDTTEQKKMEYQLAQAQKMEAIGTLAAGIAHDFNNILSVVIGHAEILEMAGAIPAPAHEGLGQIIAAGQRAKDLVRQILAFSRHGKREKLLLNLNPLIKETLGFLRASLPATIQLRHHLDEDIGTVMADPTQMQQILMNLCTNAAHAMENTAGTLEISLCNMDLTDDDVQFDPDAEPGRYVGLSVSDTGRGIEPEVLPRIFAPYFTTKEPGKGTGLGLSVVHGIVKSHGGMIKVYSDPGKGTTFRVFLPRIGVAGKTEPAASRSLPEGHECILFVDDEPALAEVNRQMLSKLGYRVEVRTSPIEALEAFRAKPAKFDLVITDLSMPQMTGLKLARKIGEIRPAVPIILCTGFGDQANEARAHAIGIRAFLLKPLVMSDLAEAVRKALDGGSRWSGPA